MKSQWPKVGLRAAIKSLNKLYILCQCFAIFHKQANVGCSIGSISRLISLRDHYAADQVIRAGTKATSENLIMSFLENNKVQ